MFYPLYYLAKVDRFHGIDIRRALLAPPKVKHAEVFGAGVIPYGGYGTYDGCQYRDRCEGPLVPMNVDSRSSLYPKAPAGGFSCWGNVPDVLCTWTSKSNDH